MLTIWQKIKKFFLHFFTLKDTPHNIAAGFALGIFLGIVPSAGPLTVLVVASFLGFNKSSGLIGAIATNAWGTVVVMPIAATVGGFLFNTTPDNLIQQFNEAYSMGLSHVLTTVIFMDLALPMIVGLIIVSGVISIVSYFLLYLLLKHKKLS